MITHLIFDFDGTLADTLEVTKIAIKNLAPKYGVKVPTDEELEGLRQHGAKELIKMLKINPLKIPAMARDGSAEMSKNMHLATAFAGMAEALQKLKAQGKVLGIVTSNSVENVEVFLNRFSLNYFDFIHSEPSLFGKHIAIKKTLKEQGIPKSNAVYIGDEIRDIEASHKAGIKVAAVTWGLNTSEALKAQNPDYILNSPTELTSFLN